MPRFPGFSEPTFTQVPNEWIDILLPQIETKAEILVTEIVIRYTFGFHRKSARLSLSFLERASGLSRPSVIAGVRAAVKRGTITRTKSTQRISINFKSGSKASLLADGKENLPKVVKQLYPRNKKQVTHINKEKRKPSFQGRLFGGQT